MARLDARRTNLAVFTIVISATITGLATFLAGARSTWWLFFAHGAIGFALVAILWWKAKVIWRGLTSRRPGPSVWLAILTLGVLLAILGTGVYSAAARGGKIGPWTMLELHVGGALIIIPLFVVHLFGRWVPPDRRDASRRVLLRAGALAGAGLLLRGATEGATRVAGLAGSKRRFTGSHLIGKPGERFPDVSWLFDDPKPIDASGWSVLVTGDVNQPLSITYEQLAGHAQERIRTTLDCTGGWYSEQEWEGVSLSTLLDRAGVREGARSIVVKSVTGYSRAYTVEDARGLLIAMRVAGQPLTHGHGFPARIVAPGKRGYWWVKWVRSIEASSKPAWMQPPVPLQ